MASSCAGVGAGAKVIDVSGTLADIGPTATEGPIDPTASADGAGATAGCASWAPPVAVGDDVPAAQSGALLATYGPPTDAARSTGIKALREIIVKRRTIADDRTSRISVSAAAVRGNSFGLAGRASLLEKQLRILREMRSNRCKASGTWRSWLTINGL